MTRCGVPWRPPPHLATASGLDVQSDERLRGRMNFDGTQSMEEFLSEWARTAHDRGFVPPHW
jgi:hypothetical protein